jgi:hypothetical protein
MDSIMRELIEFNKHIESVYIIGSYQTKYEKLDSDIDVVLIIREMLLPKPTSLIRKKIPGVDLILLNMHSIETEIQKTPSYYLSAINQIKLNPRKIYGSGFVEQYSLCAKRIEINQLHFPLFAIKKILYQNRLKTDLLPSYCDSFEMFEKLDLGSQFSVAGKKYYSYRALSTLLLTLCSYKLIQYNLFYCNRAGKHWFLEDYLQLCMGDSFYTFLHNYHYFMQTMNSNVFDKRSWYLEHPAFKSQLFDFFNEYWQYLSSRLNLHYNL